MALPHPASLVTPLAGATERRSRPAPIEPERIAVNESHTRRPKVISGRIATVARVLFIITVSFGIAYVAQAVILPALFGVVAAMTLRPPVRWLHERHLPEPLAAALVVGIVMTIIGWSALRLGQPAVEWVNAAPENVPRLTEKIRRIVRPAARLSAVASTVGKLDPAENGGRSPQTVEVKSNAVASTVFQWTGSLLLRVGEMVAFTFLLLASGDRFTQKLVNVLPNARDKRQAVAIVREAQQNISTYLFSVGLVNLGFGVAVALGLAAAGMPNAMMWGAVAAVVNFVPYFGPVAGMAAVGVAGVLAFDTLGRGLLPAGVYLGLHLIEANFVTPFFLGRRCTLNSVVIFAALCLGNWLWGMVGALLAVPLLVILKVICDRMPFLRPLGEFISR